MKKQGKTNSLILVLSSTVSKIGDVLFDYVNNMFLAGINLNSLVLVGIYQSLESIMGVLFNIFGGAIADRFRRKKIIILSDFLSGIVCVTLAFISNTTWLIYAIVLANVLLAFVNSFSSPAYKAFTKEIVKKDDIVQVNSYLQISSTMVKIIVPLVAIAVYHSIGIHGALLLDGISFIVSGLILLLIVPIFEEVKQLENFSLTSILVDIRGGFQYLFKKRQIFILILLSASVNFLLAAYNLLLPYGNVMFPKVNGGVYGAFLTAEAVGGLVGAFLSSRVNKKLRTNQLMLFLGLSGLFIAIIPIFYRINTNIVLLSVAPGVFSLFLTIYNIQFFSMIQRDVDSEYLGRIFSIIFTVAILFMPLGTVIFTLILHSNFEFNLLFVGLAIIVLAFIFSKAFLKNTDNNNY